MKGARTVKVHVLNPVRRLRPSLRVNPLIALCTVLRLTAAKQERRSGDKGWINLVAALGVLAIQMEPQIPGLFARLPLEQCSAAGDGLRLERRQIHSPAPLDCLARGRT